MPHLFANDALSTINGAITDAATTILLASDANLFPSPSGSYFAHLTLFDFDGNKEIVKLTARSGATCTVVRGQEGTTARAWPSGSRIEFRLTAAQMTDFSTRIDAVISSLPTAAITDGTIDGTTIGATTPAAAAFSSLLTTAGSLGTTSGDELVLGQFTNNNGNVNYLEIINRREANGGDWTTTGTRIQQRTDGVDQGYIQFNGNGNEYGITFGTNTGEKVRIDTNGNVGIGISSPQYRLDVGGGTDQYASAARIGATGHATSERAGLTIGDWVIGQDAWGAGIKDFFLYGGTSPGAKMVIATSGNVGIGTTSPSALLDVQGEFNASNLTGLVAMFARSTAPAGWLKANGAAVSRTTYAALFAAIGTTYGVGDGSTTFNLPDLRGEFVRGWDDGRGVDSGRAFGSGQGDEIKIHHHAIGAMPATGGVSSSIVRTGEGNSGGYTTDNVTQSTGGSETRPRNVALLACIKY